MAYSGPTASSPSRLDPATVGAVLSWLGLAVIAVTGPVVVGALAGLLVVGPSPASGVTAAVGAMDGPLLGGFGLTRLFHVATLAALCGGWLLGAGLLLEGLFD